MAGLAPNSLNIARTKREIAQFTHLVVHPEVEYWAPEWTKIRDAIAGEREIKRKGAVYLRPMNDDKDHYAAYLERAVFYNMSAQTLAGMVGQVFRRPPTIRNLPVVGRVVARGADGTEEVISQGSDHRVQLQRFAKDGTSHQGFSKTTAAEQIAMGRFGALVDAPETSKTSAPSSYVVGYTTENILDWTIEDVDGFYQPTRILVREFEREGHIGSQDNTWIGQKQPRGRRGRGVTNSGAVRPTLTSANGYNYTTIYRELVLETQEDGSRIYVQNVYKEDVFVSRRVPLVRGNPLSFIPFVFFGASSNAADCEKPPLLDIVDLNLKHYRTYADLEHGRFYTALPTYYAPGNADNDAAEYAIGPAQVWEVPSGETPGILEFKGEGLKTLERALNEKEQQIAAIGGRLMPGMSKSVSESDNQSALREANEQSLLLNVILALEEGMTTLVRYWLMFRDVPLSETATLRYEIDTTFRTTALDARSLRAIQQLYEGGLLPIEALYENFIKNGLVPSTMTLEEFKAKMDDPKSFIGQPDVMAMRRGFANRGQELDQTRMAREASFQERELSLEERRLALEEEKFEIARRVDSTSVTASRKLGDPEQAAPSKAEQAQVKVQSDAAKAAAKAAAAKPAAPAVQPGQPRPAAPPKPKA